jgi:hypothetical protein
MLTKDILFGMNILTLAGFVMMGITLTLNRTGQAGRALSIGRMGAGTALVFAGLYAGAAYGDSSSRAAPQKRTPTKRTTPGLRSERPADGGSYPAALETRTASG